MWQKKDNKVTRRRAYIKEANAFFHRVIPVLAAEGETYTWNAAEDLRAVDSVQPGCRRMRHVGWYIMNNLEGKIEDKTSRQSLLHGVADLLVKIGELVRAGRDVESEDWSDLKHGLDCLEKLEKKAA